MPSKSIALKQRFINYIKEHEQKESNELQSKIKLPTYARPGIYLPQPIIGLAGRPARARRSLLHVVYPTPPAVHTSYELVIYHHAVTKTTSVIDVYSRMQLIRISEKAFV